MGLKQQHGQPAEVDHQPTRRNGDGQEQTGAEPYSLPAPLSPVPFGEMMERYSTLREPVVDGVARRGEICNINAQAKMGKTWFAYSLAFAIIAAEGGLICFPVEPVVFCYSTMSCTRKRSRIEF